MTNLTLRLFTLDCFDDYVKMWSELDADYSAESETDEHFELLKEGKYKSLAEKHITEIFKNWNDCDASRLDHVLQKIKEGHGSFSHQFQYEFSEGDNNDFSVAVGYLS
jgi:hypothetical protein